jgi:hypothetical protein
MGRAVGYGVAIVCGALMVVPTLRDPPVDSFPLSTYPMFSTRRSNPWVHTAVGVAASGVEERLGPALIAGSHEVMQAAQTVRNSIRGGRGTRRALCAEIAQRVAQSPAHDKIVEIEIISLRFDPVAYFTDPPPQPLRRKRRAHCPVPGRGVER